MWDNIELLTSDDIGSGLLGAHSRQERGVLYQIDTLVKVASSAKIESNPQLHGQNLSDGCVVVVERTVVVLDHICQSLQMSIQYETEVDVVGLCQKGKFLVVGERSGNLHLLHVPSKQTLLTKKLVQGSSNDRTYLNLLLQKESDDGGTYHAFILTKNGFFCIMHLPLAKTQEVIEKMDLSTAQKLQGQVETCFISTEDYHTAGCLTSVIRHTENMITLIIGGVGDSVVSVWEVNTKDKLVSIQNVADSGLIEAAEKLQITDGLLFVLDNENILTQWDVHSLTMTWDCHSVHVEEFLLTSESDFSTVAGHGIASVKLVALTKPSNNTEMRSIMVFSLPAMHQLYSLEVTRVSSLVHCGINTDTVYFLEGIYENNQKSSDISVSFVVLRCLTEALPENRLSRLLHNHRFTEAENFAIQFGLDIELVYKVKVSCILERLVSESVGSDGQSVWLELVVQAKETLNKIEDNQFVTEYCINTPWPTYETAQEMLNYACSRIKKRDDTSVASLSAGDLVYVTEVLRAQTRLTTFLGAFGLQKFSGNAWLEFLNNRYIFKDILLQLKEENLSAARYLWLRHQADFKDNFGIEMLDDLLAAIPVNVPLKELCLWFKSVIIPFVRQAVPQGQKRIAEWLEREARNLELTDKANWPENGLEMAQVFFTSKNPEQIGLASSWHLVPWNDCQEVCLLTKLVSTLRGLVDLYRKYNCRLALCDFEKKNANAIVFHMFDKVLAPELIPTVLEKYIEPYMEHHSLQKDEILLQYIQDLLERYCTRSTSVFDTTWEAKAIAIVGCMSNIDLILEGVLAIMYGAVVPWSPAVEQLVQQYLNTEHVKVKQLQEGYKLMEMKTLLRSYGIRDINLLNDKQMMLMVVKYILKQDTLSSLEDALKIVHAYMLPTAEVYIWRIVNLIDKKKGEDIMSLLKSLPPEEAVEIAERTLICGRYRLEEEMDDSEEELKTKLCVKKLCVDIIKFLLGIQKENPLKMEEYESDLKLFRAIAALQEKFNVCISIRDYEDPSFTCLLLEEHIKAYKETRRSRKTQDEGTSSEESGIKTPLTYSRLRQLALLLQRTEQEMGSELVLRELDAGRVEEALKICRDSYELHQNEQSGQLLFSGCQKLCCMLGSDTPMVAPEGVDLPAVVNNMACQTATICSRDLLLDAVELCKYTSFAHEISRKCQIEDYGVIPETTSSGADVDPYTEWTFDDFFREDGAVLDSPTVLPVVYEVASSIVPVAEWKTYPLDSTSLAYCPFVQGKNLYVPCTTPVSALLDSLQECSQLELSLGLISNSFGALFQHMMTNNMDVSLGEKVCQLHGQEVCHNARRFLLTAMQGSTSMIKSMATALLHKVFNSRRIDHTLALGYCTLLPKEIVYEKLWDIINKASQNYSKILAVSLVGAQFASHYEETEKKQAFEELISDAEWGIQLGKLGISFQNVFRMPSLRKRELLRSLVQHPNVDTALISKFCNTFQLDKDAALLLCIETPLLRNASAIPAEGGSSGDTGTQPHASVLAKAAEIIPLLNSTSSLVTNLNAILLKLDPYDYETIESVLIIMEMANGGTSSIWVNRALMLIKHLKSYKRISPPGDPEHQYVFEQGIPLSPAAQTRLPFHLIFFRTAQCFWKIISAELSEESFPKLLLISRLMQVSSDTLHMRAVHHMFQGILKPQMLKLMRDGYLSVVNKETAKTMRTIQSYMCSIANPEWAVALAQKIAQELPTGPIKVQALKFCLGLAEKWKNTAVTDESCEKAQAHLKTLQLQHRRSATEAVLAARKLNSEVHRKIIGKPASLVVLLYQHSSISERFQNPAGRDYPDIHAAAKEIAEINNLDMKKIWDTLLEKWLCPDVQPADKNPDVFGNVQEDEDFKRVIYLLQPRPLDYSLRILYEFTISTTSPIGINQLTFAHRRRALRCLIHLADPCAVESLFKKPIEEVMNFLKCLIFLAEFETLNIPYTDKLFQRTPKEGMIKGLWKNHNHEPKAVKLVTELSLEYRVFDPVLWNGLLQKLIAFKMIHYLKNVLVAITGISSLWQIPNYGRAWRSVVLAPLLSVSCPLSSSQLEACYESFKTLLRCPVLDDLDVTGIAKQCVLLDLPALALGCLLLIPQLEKRAQQIQAILASCQLETILQQVEEHMSQGDMAVYAPQIRCLILDYIITKKYKGLVLATYSLLKLQEMDRGKFKALVENLIDENRMDDAATLITEYLKQSGNPIPSDRSPSAIVKIYLSEPVKTEKGTSSF
ncbi:kinetochore-associated protein 1 [Tiliqua scincoides]|uniref:kinetochore-associated protein 1 n=1 Tax=Tiliqua scincoides TaxID=71010 RepID=UPI003461B4CF